MKKYPDNQKASVLILTLFIVFFLSSIALSISHATRIKTKIISRHIQNQAALKIAESAVFLALAELKADKKDNNYDCFDDRWYEKFHNANKVKDFKFKNSVGEEIGEYRIDIQDEAARMNINTASSDLIENLIYQVSKKDNSKTVQAIKEYRESLRPKKIIRSVYELLKIKAMDKTIFWGEDTNANDFLDKGEDDQADSLPEDNGNGRLEYGVKDFFTVFTDGKINLNTASEKILLSIPGMTEQGAKTIVNIRENQPFQDEKVLEAMPFLSKQANQFIIRWGTVNSDLFRVIVMARVNQANNYKQIIAIADRSYDPIKIIYWREN
ncbi:MAG: general secretion pathway protein GspK [Candidatus Omnitrophica bacterium]|nr:general secretion pathway protein GspK [Candidatus Omnitrophota bacterium]